MSDPTWAPARRLAGNYDDDDGQVISDLVTSDPTPPDPFPAAATAIPAPSPEPKRQTRMLSGTFTLDPANPAPQLIVPADLDREALTVRVVSDNPTDYVLVGEDANRVNSPASAHRIMGGGSQGFDNHTGALWVGTPPQPNLADGISYDGTTWLGGGGTVAAASSVPWPSGRGVTLTATAAGAINLRSPAFPSFFARSGQTVGVRAKVVSNLFSNLIVGLGKPNTTSLVTSSTTVQAPAQVGWKEVFLTGVITTDAQGGVSLTLTGTAAAVGDVVTIGDIVVSDRAFQGLTVVSYAAVTL